MSAALVIGDTASSAVRSAVRAARACVGASNTVDVLLIGSETSLSSARTEKWEGVSKVLLSNTPRPTTAESVTAIARKLIGKVEQGSYGYVIAAADTFGKNVIPRLAGTMGLAALSDVTKIINSSQGIFVRPMYAGNAIATVQISEPIKMLTIRPTSFTEDIESTEEKVQMIEMDKRNDDEIEEVEKNVRWIGEQSSIKERPELGAASVVVAGGRGLKSKEHFKMLEEMADVMKGAVGATRAAVDLGWVSNDLQIGQTGKVVAPQLYFAVGLSGAIQHLAGMKDSKTIVAINKDADAPIFQIADYGLVGDLFEVIPQLIDKIKSLPKKEE